MSSPALDSPLVSTQWLADHLGTPGLVVLDGTVLDVAGPGGGHRWLSGYDQYLVAGHVPGAQFAEILELFSDPRGEFSFTRPSESQFLEALDSVGITAESTVIAYDASVGLWAARLWWLFRSFGFDNFAVLDGGLTRWRAEQRQIDFGHVALDADTGAARFTPVERPELWASKEEVAEVVRGDASAVLVCALPAREFTGETSARTRAGHIPGSVNVPAGRLVDRSDNSFLRGDALHAQLSQAFARAADTPASPASGSPTPGSRTITYCGGGIAAASAALALTLVGARDVAIYDGSLSEWVAEPGAPLTVLA